MRVEVAVLGSLPNKPTVSVDVKQYFNKYETALVPRGFADVSAHAVRTP